MNTNNIAAQTITAQSNDQMRDRHSLKKRDERLFQALFFLSFPVFLAFVLTTRLMPVSGENKKQTSVMNEARESARSTIALALTD